MVKSLKKKLHQVLEKEFQDASVELEKSGIDKVAGFLIWKGFEKVEQIERQEKLWHVLENNLKPEELLHVSVILTLTPNEKPVPMKNRPKNAG